MFPCLLLLRSLSSITHFLCIFTGKHLCRIYEAFSFYFPFSPVFFRLRPSCVSFMDRVILFALFTAHPQSFCPVFHFFHFPSNTIISLLYHIFLTPSFICINRVLQFFYHSFLFYTFSTSFILFQYSVWLLYVHIFFSFNCFKILNAFTNVDKAESFRIHDTFRTKRKKYSKLTRKVVNSVCTFILVMLKPNSGLGDLQFQRRCLLMQHFESQHQDLRRFCDQYSIISKHNESDHDAINRCSTTTLSKNSAY